MQRQACFLLSIGLVMLALVGCASSPSRINDYLTGFQPPSSEAPAVPGEAAFSGAADQLGMKLRQRLDPQPAAT